MNYIEIQILKLINTSINCAAADTIFKFISFLGNKGILWIILTLILLISPKSRKAGICSAISLIICLFLGNMILKPLFGRIRPYDFDPAIMTIIPHLHDPSFPSGHTMAAFAFASSVSSFYKKSRPYLYGSAVLMGVSRVYLYMHYPTDVLFGALFGMCFGAVSIKIYFPCFFPF